MDRTARAALRRALLAEREAMPTAAREAAQAAIVERLLPIVGELLATRGTAATAGQTRPVIGAYVPFRGEPDLSAAVASWRAAGWDVALPKVVAPDAPLVFGRWDEGATLVPGRYGIAVPEPFVAVRPSLLVAPCVGFDPRGFRLGYGGGFYDRTIAALGVPAVGVAFDEARIESFEPGPFDARLDALVTPGGAWRR